VRGVEYLALIRHACSSSHVEELVEVAKLEQVDYEMLKRRVASGKAVIPRNTKKRKARLLAIGEAIATLIL
jgi:thiamine biosynthesis protein ThiC